jgi:hypothetical protein
MFFEQFPKLRYNFVSEGLNEVELVDIFRRVAYKFTPYAETTRPTIEYYLESGDTPDLVANKIYGNDSYWWLVCLYANIINPFNEFSRSGNDVQDTEATNLNYAYSEDYQRNDKLTVYLQRLGGSEGRDFKAGDFLILGKEVDSGLSTSYTERSGKSYNLFDPKKTDQQIKSSNGVIDEVHVLHINSWDQRLRKAVVSYRNPLTPAAIDARVNGTTVMVFSNNGDLQVHGVIVRKENPEDNKLVGFERKDNAFPVSPLANVHTKKIAGASASDALTNNIVDIKDTIIEGFLGISADSKYDNSYVPRFAIATSTQSNIGSNVKPKIRLLDPQYKEEAFRLFKDTIKSDKFTINEFSQRFQDIRIREFALPVNPNSNVVVL